MNLVRCENIDRHEWSVFLINHPAGNIFQTPEYYDLMKSVPGYEPLGAALVINDDVNGILTGVIIRDQSRLLRNLTARAVVIGGPVIHDWFGLGTFFLIDDFYAHTWKKVLFSQYRNLHDTSGIAPVFRDEKYRYDDHLDIHIRLDRAPDEILASFHPTRRKQIGRGYRRGLKVDCDVKPDDDLTMECWSLLRATYRKAGLPVPPAELLRNASGILGPEKFRLFTARAGEKLAAFRMVLTYKDCVYDWYAASDPVHNDKYPNDILPWEVMRWGSLKGYNTFCFGGAGKPGKRYGVRDHKLKFGGSLVNYGRYERIHRPLLYHAIMIPFNIRRRLLNR